jgi:hypothetical protein
MHDVFKPCSKRIDIARDHTWLFGEASGAKTTRWASHPVLAFRQHALQIRRQEEILIFMIIDHRNAC